MAEKNDREFTSKEYVCGYCKYVWQQYVRRIEAGKDVVTHRPQRHAVSSQVQCPRCKNGCKTWDEGKEIKAIVIPGAAYERVKNVAQPVQ